jgi:hypothetical protein
MGRVSRRNMKGAQEMTSAIAALRCQRLEIEIFRAIVLHALYNSAKTVKQKPMLAFSRIHLPSRMKYRCRHNLCSPSPLSTRDNSRSLSIYARTGEVDDKSTRSFERALAKRDITVPGGQSSRLAISW